MLTAGTEATGVEGTDFAITCGTVAEATRLDCEPWAPATATAAAAFDCCGVACSGVLAAGVCDVLASLIEILSKPLGGEGIFVDLTLANRWCSFLSSFQLSFLYAAGAGNGDPVSDIAAEDTAELSYSEPE